MTTIKVDKITPGSGTTTTLGDSGDTFTIPAGVTFANSGSTNMGDLVTYCSTTKSASFTAVANKGYFINTSDASPFLNYAVTVASGTLYVVGGTGNVFNLDGSRTMAITLLKGRTYRFTQTDNTNDGHPLVISTSNSSTLGTMQAGIVSSGVSYYLDGASNQTNYTNTTTFNAATTRYIEFQPPATGTYYFACYVHGIGMGGAITSEEFTVTLPSSPTVGTEMIIIDSTGDANTNKIVLGRNGSKVKGQCVCFALTDSRVGVRLIYSDASQGWVTVTSANETAPAVCGASYVTASGGTETTSGNFKIHTFTSDGTFTVSDAGNSLGSNTVSYVVVAGGGATQGYSSKGGGAGGYREGLGLNDSFTGSPLRSPTGVPVSAQAYPITVGAGGSGGPANYPSTATSAQKGNNSIFSTITSAGGGSGSGGSVTRPSAVGNGGSGGNGASGNEPPVSPPQGNDGGPSGGGGAGEAGDTDGSGQGGDGVSSEITGSAVTRAGGGGGGGGVGGDGGGGPSVGGSSGTFQPGTSGTANTGGGAGGGSDWSSSAGSGNASGGSGIVIIRYKYQN